MDCRESQEPVRGEKSKEDSGRGGYRESSACAGRRPGKVVRSKASGWVLVPSCGWTWKGPSGPH